MRTYGYDSLNRLATASDTGGWAQNFNFDRYGKSVDNREHRAATRQTADLECVYSGDQPFELPGNGV